MKKHYFFKLIPPRPTFPQDISDEETRLMNEHGQYFHEQFTAGRVLLYGPVMAKEHLVWRYSKSMTRVRPTIWGE